MNEGHLTYLASPEWAQALRTDLLPWLETVADLGDDVLEIGPGPGLTTDLLRESVAAVTAVEIDPDLAAALADRLAGTNVDVISGDATTTQLPADRFSAATCFSMLHHMPSPEAQDRLFAELHRVLRPDGALVAIDSLDTERIRNAHVDDTFVPLDPATLGKRLEAAGFTDITIAQAGEYRVRGDQIRFTARK
jgi:SAM-dependent methyltransferase